MWIKKLPMTNTYIKYFFIFNYSLIKSLFNHTNFNKMKNNKFWIGGIVGGVLYFLLGWLIYGKLLMEYMNAHSGISKELHDQVFKPETQFNWGALIASNLLGGFLLAAIIGWARA